MIPMQQIVEFIDQIVRHFDPEKIVLFGSYAYGEPDEDSDVDLLVIMPFEGRSRDVRRALRRRTSAPFSNDIVIRTPEDAARRYRECDPLVREAIDKGVTLYERNRSRMVQQGRG